MTAIDVSVVLPCFEEEAGLASLVEELRSLLADATLSHEIVIVASAAAADGTLDLARRLAEQSPCVRAVVQARDDGGYGRALGIGVAACRQDWVLWMDADGQFEPRDAIRLIALASDADVVVGYRAARRDPLGRRLSGALYVRALRAMTGLRVRDVDCGLKLFRRSLVEGVTIASRTGVANAELLLAAQRAGARFLETPVNHAPRRAGRARFQTALGLPSPREATRMMREALALAGRCMIGAR